MNFPLALCFILIAIGNFLVSNKLDEGRESIAVLQDRVLVLEEEQAKMTLELRQHMQKIRPAAN